MLIFWIIVFLFSLAAIVKGADWLLTSSEKIGLALGLTPFIVGVTIVGAGTSLPELASSLIAVFEGALDVPVANAVGSNLFNILIIAGASAVVAKKLAVTKDIVDLDIPLIFISTVFYFVKMKVVINDIFRDSNMCIWKKKKQFPVQVGLVKHHLQKH